MSLKIRLATILIIKYLRHILMNKIDFLTYAYAHMYVECIHRITNRKVSNQRLYESITFRVF